MKIGNLVKKIRGERMQNNVGVIVKIYNENNQGYIVMDVLTPNGVVTWAESLIEVLNEAR